ncbi:hypothetical protein ACFSKW_28335 [Nonomuraea mangrovi]|uniref:Aspartate/glutamate/uridylate kinase domain-containing protein n=1 Tax=Nonomuraea mangrovi TaxID=2316207 RepID=A0ABW4T0C9_9ACTN
MVPSPMPLRVVQAPLVRALLEAGQLVVCVGGGGVPVKTDGKGRQTGVQAVVDKDLASAALAAELQADMLIMLTDAAYVSENWGTPAQRDILTASPEAISELPFEEGSMKPKIDAAVRFAKAGGRALIGPLDRLDDLLAGRSAPRCAPTYPRGSSTSEAWGPAPPR